MKKIVVAVPHSHAWFWLQTCVSSLKRNPPRADGFDVEVVVIDNSPWSPAIRGVCDTCLGDGVTVIPNHKSNAFHASALDCVVDDFEFDYLMALETDVMVLRPEWLQWFVDQMRDTDFAVGMWHHEQFVNPSCTLYRGAVLREMKVWCQHMPEPTLLRWGPLFGKSQPIADRQPERDYRDWFNDKIDWIAGPFSEKRGWPAGTLLKEKPSGQDKGPGWYEPGQQLHHWAVEAGYTYTVCPSVTTTVANVPVQTMYGDGLVNPDRQLEVLELIEGHDLYGRAQTVHLWGGTRALDIIKHDVTCQFVRANTPIWLAREARFWRQSVPEDVRAQTLELIRKYGFHYRGQGSDRVSDRDREAALFVKNCYEAGGVSI